MTDKVKITFVLPEALQRDLKGQIISDGYDLKGKSKWVSEAIEMLLDNAEYMHLVKLNDEMSGFDKFDSVLLVKDLKTRISSAAIEIRRTYPALEGVQSRIMRTAIVQRLLRS